MNNIVIGRNDEIAIFKKLLQSRKAEFLAVYGRRRVGKTFLIKQVFQKNMIFQFSGAYEVEMPIQLDNFYRAFTEQTKGKTKLPAPNNWFEAFHMLAVYAQKASKRKTKAVIFLDELPWLDTPKSRFVSALGFFWNSHIVDLSNVILVICGSASSWINKKIFRNRGGLHNRVTERINLKPFSLAETEALCKHKKLRLTRYQITQIYMAFGGIPFYLDELTTGKSAIQIIDEVCFSKHGLLKTEYHELYHSLFKNADNHIKIVEALASKPYGLTKTELSKITKLPLSGSLLRPLEELEACQFISYHHPVFNMKRNGIYRLIDLYTLFYLKFIKRAKQNISFENISTSHAYKVWSGYAFENVCMLHIAQIKKALGISGISAAALSWKFLGNQYYKGTQIDLVIDRADNVINLCEIKFHNKEFTINKAYFTNTLRHKRWAFLDQAKTKKAIYTVLISTFGAVKNKYYFGEIQREVLLDDLFE